MLLTRLITIAILLHPLQAWCDYDSKKIKSNISNQAKFKVSEWKKSEKDQIWKANTKLKYVTIKIGETESQFIAPYINPRQMKSAKILCADFAATALTPKNKDQVKQIKSTIRKATTRHHLQFIKMNNVKFSVEPKLTGAVVRLHCSAKKI
jgi:hypothetical protein